MEALIAPFRDKLYQGQMNLRVLTYLLESFPLLLMKKLLGKGNPGTILPPKDFPEVARKATKELIDEELRLIQRGLYNYPGLPKESPKQHIKTYAHLLKDAFSSVMRSRSNITKDFHEDLKQELENTPEYYQRNFHFQTDGYLSDTSASLYKHQTEILFRGTLQIMRRVLLSPVVEILKYNKHKKHKILDIGCGTGEAIRFLTENYENLEIDAIDLSQAYMNKAKHNVENNAEVRFHKMPGENLKFEDNSFDMVYSCFLFHEVPQKIREKIFEEAYRVVKPGGKVVLVDSLQNGDKAEFDWALHNFPIEFHEPFYKNYVNRPMNEMHSHLNLTEVREQHMLLSKGFSYTKPEEI